jgi:hypothetical protein
MKIRKELKEKIAVYSVVIVFIIGLIHAAFFSENVVKDVCYEDKGVVYELRIYGDGTYSTSIPSNKQRHSCHYVSKREAMELIF